MVKQSFSTKKAVKFVKISYEKFCKKWKYWQWINQSEISIWFLLSRKYFYIFSIKYYYFLYIGIGFSIGRYEKYYIGILSVLANKKIEFIGLYRYWEIRKKAYQSPTAYSAITFLKYIFLQNYTRLFDSLTLWESTFFHHPLWKSVIFS